jgi:hypothetical protein
VGVLGASISAVLMALGTSVFSTALISAATTVGEAGRSSGPG